MSDMKECPFCGGEGETFESTTFGFAAICSNRDKCSVEPETPFYPTEQEAVEAWNTRYEKTCNMRDSQWDDGQCVWGCKCTECGRKFTYESGITWNYCPNCGAKVVD